MRLSCFDDTAAPEFPNASMVTKDSGSTSSKARVVARYPNHVRIVDSAGREFRLSLTADQRPVVGDFVEADYLEQRLIRVRKRTSLLSRRTRNDSSEAVAANLTQLAVVLAPTPAPDWALLDRYLVGAEVSGIEALLIVNKSDLEPIDPARLSIYRKLRYRALDVSVTQRTGLNPLSAMLVDELTLFVGQSGVGKSSLMNALAPHIAQTVGELSAGLESGRHTTTTARLAALEGGGEIIDAPGVRDFYPALASFSSAQIGFREIARHARDCRFRNCAHGSEPGCAVTTAVEAGAIASSRYSSFQRLVNTL